MEHAFYITAYSNGMLPKAQQHPQQARSEGGSWQQQLIEIVTVITEGTIKNNPVFLIVTHHMMWDEPRLLGTF